MKKLIPLFLILTINLACGTTRESSEGFRTYVCKSKDLPVNVKYEVQRDLVKVDLNFEKKLEDFEILNVKGVDGLKVSGFVRDSARDVAKNETESLEYAYVKPEGLAYMVLEIKAKLNGTPKIQIVSIPVGELSMAQKEQRGRNVETIEPSGPESEGPNPLKNGKKRRVHKLPLEKVK